MVLVARVMADQLEHVEELNELPGFEFRVVDGESRPYFGQSASFTMMRFVEKRFDGVVLLHTLHGGDTWLESVAEREPYERALTAFDGALRSEQESACRLGHASLRLRDPLPGNDSGDQQRNLRLVTAQTGR
ncbi:Scr1 family TA system antitoxin-like transcriptional regulator [Lentzea sp. NPDC004782]|uniref:Scr1 family TA system antitoxin-like transcriptional regulator n=1 Tax=Lentzea sp. NPDC004782 TaxID=3154458 RepID=UPI0033A77B59